MIRYVIVSSKEENIKGYKQIIDKEMMGHDICYRYCIFNNNDKSFKSYCSLKNTSNVFIIDNDDEVNSLEVIKTIRNEYKMYFSFIVIIDKNGVLSYEKIKKENSFMIDLLKEDEFSRLKYDVRYIYNSTLTRKKILTVIFDSQIYNLAYEDILYIEKERNSKKSIIHTKTDIVYTTKTLTDLEDLLDERFFRTHQSAIINLDNVKMIDPSKNYLLFNNDEKCFYLSRDKKKKLKELCDEQGLISAK